jgi:hypothetical protein
MRYAAQRHEWLSETASCPDASIDAQANGRKGCKACHIPGRRHPSRHIQDEYRLSVREHSNRRCSLSSFCPPEDLTFRRVVEPIKAETVFSVIEDVFGIERCELLLKRREFSPRDITATLLPKYCGFTQREVAKLLNVSRGATVSKQIIRSRKLIVENSELRIQVEQCEKCLNELRVTEQLLKA